MRQRGRYVTLPVVSDAIRSGQLRWNRTDGWRFALSIDGIRYIIVVSDTETNSPVVVTGWTEVESWSTAISSDRWTDDDVHTIQLRADLSATPDEQIPERIRPRSVDQPLEVGNHRVVTSAGLRSVNCLDCGCQFRSKEALRERRCLKSDDLNLRS